MNMVGDRLIRKLECRALLPMEDKWILSAAAAASVFRFGAHEYLLKQGAPIDRIFLIIEGFAARYRLLPDGRRQITAFMLPGDICDVRSFALGQMDHSIIALSPVEASVLTADAVERLQLRPRLATTLAWSALVQQSIAREWLVNVGHRTSFERLGHLLCELFERLRVVGLAQDEGYKLPLTQSDIADTLAISPVHVNRTLMEMRRSELVTFQSRHVVFHDYAALSRAAGFDPAYLHLHSPNTVPV